MENKTNDDSLMETSGEEREETSQPVNYADLFEIWADFDDAEAPDGVTRLIETRSLGPVDAVSFTAFCHGYEQRARRKL
jgi:hypothetical protein